MAHLRVDFRSEALDMGSSMTVILPESIPSSQARVVYMLHGLADNCTGWARYTSVERYARAYNLALVIPEVQRSFYTDMKMGLKYFTFVSSELRQLCSNMFGFSSQRSQNYIMGLSMGGYGALKCALTNPGLYQGCAAFSAVTDIVHATTVESRHREYQAMFGTNIVIDPDCDLNALLDKADGLPSFYMATGLQDSLLEEGKAFCAKLKAKGADAVFEGWDGVHNWEFWDAAAKRALDHFFKEA